MQVDISEELNTAKQNMLNKVREEIMNTKRTTLNKANGEVDCHILDEESPQDTIEDPIIIKEELVPEVIEEVIDEPIIKTQCKHVLKSGRVCKRATIGGKDYCDRHEELHPNDPITDTLLSAKVSLFNLERMTFMTLDKVFTAYDLHKNETMSREFEEQKNAFEEVNERLILHYGEETLIQKLCNPVVTLGLMMTGIVATHMVKEKRLIEDTLR